MALARVVAYLVLIPMLAACSPGGIFPNVLNVPPPSGVIVEQVVGQSSITPATSLSTPLQVHNGFSLALSEQNYSDVFTATILSYTGTLPDYSVAMDSSGKVAVFSAATFSPGNVDSVQLRDARGNTATVFFQNVGTSSTAPSGTVITSLPGTTAALSSSLIAPIPVTNSFSVGVQETGYSGIFAAAIVSYTAPTTAPCYAVSGGASTVQPSVFTFTPQNSTSINGTTGACSLSGDIEGVRFSDSNGNSTIQYFQLTPTPGSVPATVSKIVLSFIGSVPTNGVCGTYQLKVQAYNSSGAAITTAVTYAYPITLSIAGASNTAVITTTAPGIQSPCTQPPNAATTFGITTSPSPVYVFVNGLQLNGATTLTASAFGVPAGNIGLLTF